jgi:transposase
MLKLSVGIDIAKDTFAACLTIRYADGRIVVLSNKEFGNRKGGFTALLNWVKRLIPKGYANIKTVYVMEATGVYYEALAHFLAERDLSVCVQLANNVKNYARSLNQKSKTDKADAQTIALMGIERSLPVWQRPQPFWRRLRSLCRERVALVEEKTMIGNQRHALKIAQDTCPESLKRLEKRIEFIEKQVKEIEKQLKDELKKDADNQAKVEKVCTIKGVDTLTALTIISECDGFALFENKAQLVSFAGYDVVKKDSGEVKSTGRISKKGNRFIRRALHWPAQVAIKLTPEHQQYAQRIYDTTKIKMKGSVAIQRKLLVLIYKLFVNNTVFDPKYQENKSKENKSRQQIVQAAFKEIQQKQKEQNELTPI